MCCKRYHITFSTFSLKFKCKICVQKEVIHNFKNHILVKWPATNFLILRKECGFEKPNHCYFCLRYDPLIVFRRQNLITFIKKILIKTMSHGLLVQMAYLQLLKGIERIFITCSSNCTSQANFFFSKLEITEYDSLPLVEKQQDPSKAKSSLSRLSF